MDRETVLRLAEQVGSDASYYGMKMIEGRSFYSLEQLERFASAVAAAVKEEDARICDGERVENDGTRSSISYNVATGHCAAAIRASIKEVK